MIVTSLLSDKKYFWVKVPRTGTHAYQRVLFPELHQDNIHVFHSHAPFLDFTHAMCMKKPVVEHGVSVVRHPKDRFISILKYLTMKYHILPPNNSSPTLLYVCEFCGEKTHMSQEHFVSALGTARHVVEFLKSEDVFYDFMYSYFDKNCILKPGYTLESVFQTDNPGLVNSLLKSQIFFAYHPKVKIFKYENIQEFNHWIETTLGLSTQSLIKENTSSHKHLTIDVTTKKFHDLVRYLFHDDFQVFGYS